MVSKQQTTTKQWRKVNKQMYNKMQLAIMGVYIWKDR